MSLTNWNTAGSKTGASKTASFFESIRESPNKKGPGREPLVAGVFRNRWIQYDEPANKNIWGLLNIRKKIWKFWRWDLHEYRVTHLQTFEFRGEPVELSCIFPGKQVTCFGWCFLHLAVPSFRRQGVPCRRQAWWPASCVSSRAASAAPVAFSSSPWCGSTCGLCPGPRWPAPKTPEIWWLCCGCVTWSNHE